MGDPKYTNQLIHEKSPYLLQHAHNPVNWHPWGDEAFALAKKDNKPVLVSIGYATCHWCHVMERESFEDPELAEFLNANFYAIKVDREERPDVDSIYMKAIQALGQQGGWPLNIFVTPDGVPFYGGTYFPPMKKFNLPSFSDILHFLDNAWKNDQAKIAKQTDGLITYLKNSAMQEPSGELDSLGFAGEDKARKLYGDQYDTLHHGFRFQPQNKFPPSMGLSLLLRNHHRTGDAHSLEMVENTLRAMKHGGIYDQIGGGLSRYSTDYHWLVPHFEKMLYDNSLFVTALIETCQVTGNSEYADYANDLLEYIDRDMTHPDGGLYSAEDADSEGVEGKFYVWSQGEIEQLLDRQTASVAIPFYNVTQEGNWEHNNILNVTRSPEQLAKEQGLDVAVVKEAIAKGRRILLETRSKRIRPLLDDKVLTSWNGLMISAMARTGRVLSDDDRIAKAEKALAFIWQHLHTDEGKVLRRWRDGQARYDGYLFDYTSIAVACLDLYEATYNPDYIDKAAELMQAVEDKFKATHAYYETAEDGEDLIVRQISGYDGVEPSGNSNAALALLKLSAYKLDLDLEKRAENIFVAFYVEMMEYGLNSPFMMQALHLYLSGKKEVAIVAPRDHASADDMLKLIRTGFFPNAVFAFAWEDAPEKQRIPLLADKKVVDGKATAYVCAHGTCQAPVTSAGELKALLDDYRTL
jgi:uncharacterized protein YyaL (SSP411 family)